jgi:hypothetical protein
MIAANERTIRRDLAANAAGAAENARNNKASETTGAANSAPGLSDRDLGTNVPPAAENTKETAAPETPNGTNVPLALSGAEVVQLAAQLERRRSRSDDAFVKAVIDQPTRSVVLGTAQLDGRCRLCGVTVLAVLDAGRTLETARRARAGLASRAG